MPTISGELKQFAHPTGGGVITAYRFRNAYKETKSLIRETSHGEALRTA